MQERPNGSLFIRDVQKTDAGNLTCSATNTHGKDSISYLLTVQGECVVGLGCCGFVSFGVSLWM